MRRRRLGSTAEAYRLLTDRPHNRRPLTWERNQLDLLIMEGHIFECPWTGNPITMSIYEVDHIVPVAIYPLNELWNLVPADAAANNLKRARRPSAERLAAARPRLARTYGLYSRGAELRDVLQHDVRLRFGQLEGVSASPAVIAEEVGRFVQAIGESRNIERY